MKVTIVYDNTVYTKGLKADWGFACVVEEQGIPKILFDTGSDGAILLSNMEKLGIDPKSIEVVFISHAHYDHTGGLSTFLNLNPDVVVYAPVSFRGVKHAEKVVHLDKPTEIRPKVYSTGELDRIEQAMGIGTEKGIVLIVGCSHPEMSHILDAISIFGNVRALVGGVHGFREFELLEGMELICPTHCTQYQSEIRARYAEKTVDGGAGKVITI